MNIAELLEKQAEVYPQKTAINFGGQPVTFGQLRDNAFKLAISLKNRGINKGDKIGIYLPNCPEYFYSYLAIWLMGATAVPLDFMLTEEELISCLAHAQAKILMAKEKTGLSFERLKASLPDLKNIMSASFLEEVSGEVTPVKIEDKDYAIIFYTSGTTGKPKGVLINYRQLGAPPESMHFFVDLKENEISLCALPFSHLGGLIYLLNCVSFGMTVVLMERFIPLEFLKAVEKYKITCFWLVPSMYYALLQLKEFETFDLLSLRWVVTFGASGSSEALRRFHQYCPQAQLLNGWGLTETNAPTTVLPWGSDKIESVGRPAPWIEVKIFDEQDKELPMGAIGEVVVKSWVVTDGYYKDQELTRQVIRNSWFHTGDLGRFDENNYLYIVGRIKEMIKVSGEIVFEPEVEAALYKHPDIAEVAVVGVADKLRGEVPKAFVVLKPGRIVSEEDLRYFCRAHLAHFKIPHYFSFVENLPKNRAGKIDKEKLRTQVS